MSKVTDSLKQLSLCCSHGESSQERARFKRHSPQTSQLCRRMRFLGRSCWRQVLQKPRRERCCTLARKNSIAALAPCGVSGEILTSVTNGCSAMELCCGRSRTRLQQLTSACSSRSSCFFCFLVQCIWLSSSSRFPICSLELI